MRIDQSVSRKWAKSYWTEKHFVIDDEGEIAFYGMIVDNKTNEPLRHYSCTPMMCCVFFKDEDDWQPYVEIPEVTVVPSVN